MQIAKNLVLSALIIVVGVIAVRFIFATEPVAERQGAVRQTAMLVDVTQAERGDYRPVVRALGTVEAAREIALSARVSGRVEEVAPQLVPGGEVSAGDVLVSLDRDDFHNALAQQRSALTQAEAELRIEQGRGEVARYDLEVVGAPSADTADLALRAPQLAAAEARVDAARTAVRQADLALDRTRVRAPFDAHVLTRDVEVGADVSAGAPLARLVGTEQYWIVATVPQATLRWLAFAGEGEAGGEARVMNPSAWPEGASRRGRLARAIGALDDTTRLARVVVEVDDPLGRASGEPPLMVGAFVDVEIDAVELSDVVRLPRGLVRAGDTVWVMDDEAKLRIVDVDVLFEDDAYAYLRDGLDAGASVVATNLATVRDGAALRLEGEGVAADGSEPRP